MQQNFVTDTSRITGAAGYVPNKHMKIVGAVNFSMMGQRRRRWTNIETALVGLVKCLLGPIKKWISPMNCLSRFSCRQRMEAEYYKDIIITWLYLHRYMVMYYLVFSGQVGRLHHISTDLSKYNTVLPANTRHSPNTILMLGQRRRRWPTLRQHWLNALCSLVFAGRCHCVEA